MDIKSKGFAIKTLHLVLKSKGKTMSEWTYRELLELVNIKDKNIDHYLERITELETELDRTRKALDVAVDALNKAIEHLGNQQPLVDVMAMNLHTDLSHALDQIKTITEQKD